MLVDHLEKLKIFHSVVKEGSIRKGAEASHVSQPAVTRAIQTLESMLEERLLIRSSKGIKVTEFGRSLFEFSSSVLEGANRLWDKSRGSRSTRTSLCTMGCFPSIGVSLIPAFLKEAKNHEVTSNVTFNIKTGRSRVLTDLLERGVIDFALTINPKENSNLEHWPLYSDEFSCYFSTAHPRQEIYIYMTDARINCDGDTLSQIVQTKVFNQPCMECESFETAIALASAGIGIAILPKRIAYAYVKSGALQQDTNKNSIQPFGKHSVTLSVPRFRREERIFITLREVFLQAASCVWVE